MYQFFMIIQIIAAVALIALIMLQTPKTDGLHGLGVSDMSGGSDYKGKMGKEEILGRYTKYAAVIFFIASLLVAIIKL
ncbi:MAG: preprotein translocase subunit SecG [Armatimonadetes bacterium]|nr:preprotein translocase subunit SecG [Candidatus Hippobium faecium]